MDRRDFIGLLPAHSRNAIPDKGDSVVYYGDGHAISVDAEVRFSMAGMVHMYPRILSFSMDTVC